ncbi:MAG TPA: preprotein translocase subunit SecE [Phycisphaerales bacterium]|jgi:preprotein translocase SecE subunit|nr:preprotein translocase subunit SecE [Phycisphaerales bacterium]
MSFGIYKPGQGYWVRVMTAALIAVLALAAAGWLVKQMQLVAEKLPRTVWAMTLDKGLAETPAEGTGVTLYARGTTDNPGAEVGRAEVLSYVQSAKELRVKNVRMEGTAADPGVAADGSVMVGTAAGAPRMKIMTGSLSGKSAIQPELLEGAAAAVMLLLGAALAYWAAAVHRRFVDFLIATDGEMKKVNWSTARDIKMSTIVVIFASLVLSLSLFVVDLSFQWIFTKAGILVH